MFYVDSAIASLSKFVDSSLAFFGHLWSLRYKKHELYQLVMRLTLIAASKTHTDARNATVTFGWRGLNPPSTINDDNRGRPESMFNSTIRTIKQNINTTHIKSNKPPRYTINTRSVNIQKELVQNL